MPAKQPDHNFKDNAGRRLFQYSIANQCTENKGLGRSI